MSRRKRVKERSRAQDESQAPAPAPPPRTPTDWVKPTSLGLLLLVYAAAGTWFQFDFGEIMGYYTLFAEGLADGNLYIRPTPDQVNLVDMIPFEGRYYLQWGPFPGLFHWAGQVIGLGLTDRVATLLATWLGAWVFLEIVLLLRLRFFPESPRMLAYWFFWAYALATPAALVAYRGTVYNESISIGATAVLFSYFCLLRGQQSADLRWPLLAGAALGAAVLTRVTLGVYAAVFGVAWLGVLWVRKQDMKTYVAPLAAHGLPIVAAIVLMLAYNHARFGSPFDYGNSYKPGDTSHFAPFSLARMPENLGHYVFSLPEWKGDFPWLEHEGNQPIERVSRAEAMSSIVLGSPFLLFALVWGYEFWRRRANDRAFALATLTPALGAVAMFAVLLAFSSASRRYAHDFVPLLCVTAFAGAALFFANRKITPVWKALGIVVLIVSTLLHAQVAFVQTFRTPTPDLNVMRFFVEIGPTLRSIAPGPELNREEAMARNDLGTLFVQQQRFAEAAEQFGVASELMPDSERIRRNYELAKRMAAGRR